MKPIEDYTADELSAKIEAIKAEREKTANALKRYEEELERRKQEVPLGVPCDGIFHLGSFGETEGDSCRIKALDYNAFNSFSTEESAQKHGEMLLAWRKALVANAKGEPIDIQVLLPLLKKGWVAMDENGDWFWFKDKPYVSKECWRMNGWYFYKLVPFNLKPAENWETSLMECGL